MTPRTAYIGSLVTGLVVTAVSLYYSVASGLVVGPGLSVYVVWCWVQDRGEGKIEPEEQPRDLLWPVMFGLYAFGAVATIGLCIWRYGFA